MDKACEGGDYCDVIRDSCYHHQDKDRLIVYSLRGITDILFRESCYRFPLNKFVYILYYIIIVEAIRAIIIEGV